MGPPTRPWVLKGAWFFIGPMVWLHGFAFVEGLEYANWGRC